MNIHQTAVTRRILIQLTQDRSVRPPFRNCGFRTFDSSVIVRIVLFSNKQKITCASMKILNRIEMIDFFLFKIFLSNSKIYFWWHFIDFTIRSSLVSHSLRSDKGAFKYYISALEGDMTEIADTTDALREDGGSQVKIDDVMLQKIC